MKLFMLLLGCKPPNRHTEQHDIFFGIADNLTELVPRINEFWPEAAGKIHIDAWREVNFVDDFEVTVFKKEAPGKNLVLPANTLFFLNLGGYKKDDFEEYHYKILTVAQSKAVAIRQAKESAFFQHTGFKGAAAHIDDKYGVDVDDVFAIDDILPAETKEVYRLNIYPAPLSREDKLHIGYLPLRKVTGSL